ncbi:MAG: nucleotidyl transferase AbiEii/AbiGii toxin family protein [Thermoleophilia bacterium]|nr:nucleotidyl transferase AbiEii/AbiGii toxin family protein [Thermoleophilia bacterium]
MQVAASHLGVSRVMVEKDYWVTESLRELARGHREQFVFKGGTSLSKCFDLVHRFSEDIDLLLTDVLSTRGERDRAMNAMVDTVTSAIPLSARPLRSNRGVSRDVDLTWPGVQPNAGSTFTGITPAIRLEMGMRGSHLPNVDRPVTSLLVKALMQLDLAVAMKVISEAEQKPFLVPTLHPGRTLVEKLLLLTELAERLVRGDMSRLPARQGRHIYDVICLLGSNDVLEFLDDRDGFLAAVQHAQAVSSEHWGTETQRPADGFSASLIITGGSAVSDAFAAAYAADLPPMLMGDAPLPAISQLASRISDLADRL